jgi:tetratricopeptide (TPR) repeat protein
MLNVKLEEQIKALNVSLLTFDLLQFKNILNSFIRTYILQTQTSYRVLRDSINFNMRRHNYGLAELTCQEMLTNYPDSSESIGAISKLYLSSLSLDSAGSHIQPIKTFFETLILNNSTNVPLIKRANYFVQKCKVALKQYTSALQGFQEIINQNPYGYEGLIASWDYAATQLLANTSGAKKTAEENLTIYNLPLTIYILCSIL